MLVIIFFLIVQPKLQKSEPLHLENPGLRYKSLNHCIWESCINIVVFICVVFNWPLHLDDQRWLNDSFITGERKDATWTYDTRTGATCGQTPLGSCHPDSCYLKTLRNFPNIFFYLWIIRIFFPLRQIYA